jgi:hypothetical protein
MNTTKIIYCSSIRYHHNAKQWDILVIESIRCGFKEQVGGAPFLFFSCFFFSFFYNYCYCYYYNVHPLTMTTTLDENGPSMKTWSTMMMITTMGVLIQTVNDTGDNLLLSLMLFIFVVN